MNPNETPPPAQPPVATPPAPSVDAKIMETLESVGATLNDVDARLQNVETQIQPPAAPEPSWKPQTWDDFPKLVEEKGRAVAEEIIKQRDEAVVNAQKEEQAQVAAINTEFDNQLVKLEQAGKLQPVKDANDPNDPGRLERKELFSLAAKTETLNLEAVNDIRVTMREQGLTYDMQAGKFLRTNTPPSGALAPVGSSSGTTGSQDVSNLDYKTIHNSSMDALVRRFMGA